MMMGSEGDHCADAVAGILVCLSAYGVKKIFEELFAS